MSHPASVCHASDFSQTPPTRTLPDGASEWIHRAGHFVVVATHARAGTRLPRTSAKQDDEYFVLLPENQQATVSAGSESLRSDGDSLSIVPPGDSDVLAHADGWIYRVFSRSAADLLALAPNAEDYAQGTEHLSPLETWPMPQGGYRLRHYRLAEHARSDTPMRLFRTRRLMLNIFLPSKAPRDVRKMTPHAHVGFEQASLALRGEFVHHLRYPWTPDMTAWREDEHLHLGSPSIVVIPPPVVHTTQSLGVSGMRLVDVFAPPRDDFSLKPGLVCNAAEYPLPERLKDAQPVGEAA